MAINKVTQAEIELNQVASLPDRMSGTAAENKAAFDALAKLVIEKFNAMVDILTSGEGAANVGSAPFAGVGDAATVRDQLIALQKGLSDAVAGSIPDASITTAKLADGAATNEKIADESVTEAKIKDAEVTEAKIRDLAILTAKLADLAVTTAKLAEKAVTTEKIADGSITTEKLADGAVTLAKTSNVLQAQTGSYSGSAAKTMQLTFSFTPKVVFIQPNNNGSSSTTLSSTAVLVYGAGAGTSLPGNATYKLTVTWTSNSVKLTTTETSYNAIWNVSGITYKWLALA